MNDHQKYQCPFEPGEFYHLYNKAVGKENLFLTKDNYQFFLDKFHYHTRKVLSVYAFCLLKNHFHFLIKIHESVQEEFISEQFRRFFVSYAKSFNKEQNRNGSLFNKHLKRVKIENDEQLIWSIYYIHRNPVHHGITLDYESFKWSSYRIFVSERKTKLKRDQVLNLFSGKEQFIDFHKKNIAEDLLQNKIQFFEPL